MSRSATGKVLFCVATILVCVGCRKHEAPREQVARTAGSAQQVEDIPVPRTSGPIACNGKLDEPDWLRATRTGAFVAANGKGPARPMSEARLLHDDKFLYLGLYAADEDIHPAVAAHDGPVWTGDAFSVRVFAPTNVRIDMSPSGVVTDAKVGPPVDPSWESGTVLGVDMDGTPNDASDDDEEWIVEAAIPLASLCGDGACSDLRVELSRCDTPKNGRRVCASWGGPSTRLRLQ